MYRSYPLAYVSDEAVQWIARQGAANVRPEIPQKPLRDYQTEIDDHKWYLSEALGRDVGIRVAALDYFENVKPAAANASLFARLKDGVKALWTRLDANLNWDGPLSIVNLERALNPYRDNLSINRDR
ncbi:MAG: DUF4032 domain-containing protein [Acidobacteriaceae bacterium]|nr:DUF4032 domain-containing protein [Acidobacteriaceae bacterium]MBV9443575.1 DUF4032 domain-containing protein [Acidobacteriaceae bacterium]